MPGPLPLAVRLHAALDELSGALLAARPRRDAAEPFPGGYSALALANSVVDRALPGRGHDARAELDLGRAVRALGRESTSPILHGGFTGVAWVVERLRSGSEDDPNGPIDAALLEYLGRRRRRWQGRYDLIAGLVGYGVYALERLPRPSARTLIEQIVAHLSASSESCPPGVSWRTRPSWWAAVDRGPLSRGFNLGLSHGVPGIVAFLGRVYRAGIARRETARLLDGAVAWLLAQELPAGSASAFALNVDRDRPSPPARTAWCYGDPGVGAALLVAARASGERTWKRAAVRIAMRAATRDPRDTGVLDACLCHGAAGLAHIFNRLHVDTGDERFAGAARGWIDRTLSFRTPGRGIGGFRAWRAALGDAAPRLAWRNDLGFLTGSTGVAVALASFALEKGDEWAAWDRVLLLSG